MMTLEEFKAIPFDSVFASGILKNEPDQLFMTDTNVGGELRWVAKKGGIHDWCIYAHWAENSEDFVKKYGDKVIGPDHIRRCVPCTDEVLNLYRI